MPYFPTVLCTVRYLGTVPHSLNSFYVLKTELKWTNVYWLNIFSREKKAIFPPGYGSCIRIRFFSKESLLHSTKVTVVFTTWWDLLAKICRVYSDNCLLKKFTSISSAISCEFALHYRSSQKYLNFSNPWKILEKRHPEKVILDTVVGI